MSQNCKSPFATTQRDANNNIYNNSGGGGAGSHGCSAKGFGGPTPAGNNKGYQQVTAKVLFGTVAAINELKLQERAAREARRTH